jgi:hypothetical protein
MERQLLARLAFAAIAMLGSACAAGKIGLGCSPGSEPGAAAVGDTASVTRNPQDQKDRRTPAETDPAREVNGPHEAKPKRPSAQNTGPRDPGVLRPSAALMVTTDGAVHENIDVAGDIWIDADNVTIRNFRINAEGEYYGIKVLDGHRGVMIEDGEIFGMLSAGILGVGYTGRRLHIHDSSGDGLKAEGTATGPTVIEYSFIEKLGTGAEAHADGNQTRGGSNITFRFNNIFLPAPGTPRYPGPPYKSNSAFMLELEISNFVIEHNWLTGGNYTIYCGTDDGGVSVRNNIFGRDNGGLSEGKERARLVSGTCDEWLGNVWEDTEDPV